MSLLWVLPVVVMAVAAGVVVIVGRRLGAEAVALADAVDALAATRAEVERAIGHLDAVRAGDPGGRSGPGARR